MTNTPSLHADEPEGMTFEAAIATSQTLLDQMQQGQLFDTEVEAAIANLVATENGARGFFVTYLPIESLPTDQPSAPVIAALQTSPDIVAELLVKNLAMSSAMAVTHRRNEDEVMAQGSDRVRSRTIQLIQHLHLPAITEKAQQLHESVATGIGAYQAFLTRWGYDTEQRQVIQQAIEEVMVMAMPESEESSPTL
jgi:hypothetical protein